ncbi:MAG TPA: hypothetical protein VFW87_06390 [Pirellulales bacterium]|nr:hypothetical protein [Pirellulales bacterium]
MARSLVLVACLVLGAAWGDALNASEPAGVAATQPEQGQKAHQPKLPREPAANHQYLADLRLLHSELDRFQDHRDWRNFLLQMMGAQYSYIGRYQKAVEANDACFPTGEATGEARPAASFAEYEACDAVESILELADRHQVLMINEAHHVPLHRAFTLQLLEALYKKGFRYFAAETLTAKDSELQTRGYPTVKSGGYLREPVYADLVRTALRLGYNVVPYEHERGMPEPVIDEDPFADEGLLDAQNAREAGQAKNLYERILRKDPQAKILVHAGYGHISKKADTWELGGKKGEVRFMAVVFKELTGIEPLTIDQTAMTERSAPEKDGKDYRTAIEQGVANDKAVLLRHKTTGRWFSLSDEVYDLMVVHPRSRYENGRPTWLAMGGRREPYLVKTEARPPKGSSYLAQAFYAQEAIADAVPVDQMEYTADEPLPTLWLPRGEFLIRIIDETGATKGQYSVSE